MNWHAPSTQEIVVFGIVVPGMMLLVASNAFYGLLRRGPRRVESLLIFVLIYFLSFFLWLR